MFKERIPQPREAGLRKEWLRKESALLEEAAQESPSALGAALRDALLAGTARIVESGS